LLRIGTLHLDLLPYAGIVIGETFHQPSFSHRS
jgi:hypothetical protein